MHDDWQRAAQCQGKLAMTGAGAKKAEKNHKRMGKGEVMAFRCDICGHWHLGGALNRRAARLARGRK